MKTETKSDPVDDFVHLSNGISGLDPYEPTPAELTTRLLCDVYRTAPVPSAHQLAEMIGMVGAAFMRLAGEQVKPEPALEAPPTPKMHSAAVKKSITPDALISFEDGKPYKTLKRHLTNRGLDMDGYRAKYGLPNDYPSVAPNYSAARSEMAKKLGLGQKVRA